MSLLLCVHIHSAFVVRVLHRWHSPTFFLYWRSKLPVLRLTHSATSFSGFLPLEQVADFANPSHLLGTGGIKKNTATVRLLLEVRVAIQVNRAKDSRMLVEIEEEKKEQTAYRCPLSNVGPSLRLLFENTKRHEARGKRYIDAATSLALVGGLRGMLLCWCRTVTCCVSALSSNTSDWICRLFLLGLLCSWERLS